MASPLSQWWPLTYDRYAALCREMDREPLTRDDLRKARPRVARALVQEVEVAAFRENRRWTSSNGWGLRWRVLIVPGTNLRPVA